MWINHRLEFINRTFQRLVINSSIRSDEGHTLETSALKTLYGGQCRLSTQLIKADYLVIPIPAPTNAAAQFL